MEVPDIVFAPINSRIGFDTIYYLMLGKGYTLEEAIENCIQTKKAWIEIFEEAIRNNKEELPYYLSQSNSYKCEKK